MLESEKIKIVPMGRPLPERVRRGSFLKTETMLYRESCERMSVPAGCACLCERGDEAGGRRGTETGERTKEKNRDGGGRRARTERGPAFGSGALNLGMQSESLNVSLE